MSSSGKIPVPGVLLLGGFGMAFNLAIALHESGHCIAYLLDGAGIHEFILNPFSWSWAEATHLTHRIFGLWGGVTFGQLLALIPLLFSLWIRPAWFAFFSRLLAATAFLVNAIYLTGGAFLNFGDGGMLVSLGTEKTTIIVLGLIYLAVSLLFWSDIQRFLGMDRDTSFPSRLQTMVCGITPYMALILIYNLIHNPRQLAMWGGMAAAGLISAFLIALSGHLWAKRKGKPAVKELIVESTALKFLAAGLMVILAEFVIFGTPPNPF